jgi:hypothetical protein
MEHEHQRPDRDDYIVVLPENINDFEEVSEASINLPKNTQPLLNCHSAISAPTEIILE